MQAERDDNAERLQASQDRVESLLRAHEDAEQCIASLQNEQLHQQNIQQEMAHELSSKKGSIAQVCMYITTFLCAGLPHWRAYPLPHRMLRVQPCTISSF